MHSEWMDTFNRSWRGFSVDRVKQRGAERMDTAGNHVQCYFYLICAGVARKRSRPILLMLKSLHRYTVESYRGHWI